MFNPFRFEEIIHVRLFQSGYGNLDLDCPACGCHGNGSVSNVCDKVSGRCECLTGVEGTNCDRCSEEFYGLSEEYPAGCEGKLNVIWAGHCLFGIFIYDRDKLSNHFLCCWTRIDYSRAIRGSRAELMQSNSSGCSPGALLREGTINKSAAAHAASAEV